MVDKSIQVNQGLLPFGSSKPAIEFSPPVAGPSWTLQFLFYFVVFFLIFVPRDTVTSLVLVLPQRFLPNLRKLHQRLPNFFGLVRHNNGGSLEHSLCVLYNLP